MATDQYLDSGSFQAVITTAGKRPYTYIFRLYGADCAETDARYPGAGVLCRRHLEN